MRHDAPIRRRPLPPEVVETCERFDAETVKADAPQPPAIGGITLDADAARTLVHIFISTLKGTAVPALRERCGIDRKRLASALAESYDGKVRTPEQIAGILAQELLERVEFDPELILAAYRREDALGDIAVVSKQAQDREKSVRAERDRAHEHLLARIRSSCIRGKRCVACGAWGTDDHASDCPVRIIDDAAEHT